MSEITIGTELWYYRMDWNKRQPIACTVTGMADPEKYNLFVLSHRVAVGQPDFCFRENVPFRAAFPADGTWPNEAFCCPVGTRFVPKQEEKPAVEVAKVVKQIDMNAAINSLMRIPAWDRVFDSFDGKLSTDDGGLTITSTKGQLLAKIDFNATEPFGYRLRVYKSPKEFAAVMSGVNEPRNLSALISRAGKTAKLGQDATSPKQAAEAAEAAEKPIEVPQEA